MPTTVPDIRAAALELAQLGFAAIPLGATRRPILKGWPSATPDPTETAARFANGTVGGVGIVISPPLFVIDLDRGHADNVDGVAEFGELVRRHGGDFPRGGPRTRSRRGGVHVYLRAPEAVAIYSSASSLAPGVDCKGARTCVTAAPTRGYSWTTPPCEASAIPMAPAWLLKLVARVEHQPRPPAALKPFSGYLHPYARAALQHECAAVARCPTGVRNLALFKAAASLGALAAGGALPLQVTADGLRDAATACGLVADDGRTAVEATIASGLKRGLESPRAVPEGR